jgi:superfamily II DNA or RNA helicase
VDTTLQTKLLRRQQSPDEYRLYKAALEWDLTDPIIIEKREDFKSEYRWRDRMQPYHHQVTNLITFCRRLPVTLLADDVGLGKTISAGLVISELISRSRVTKILVVCPKLLGPQWKEELETKFDIPAEIAVGRDLIKADPEETGAVVTTYASARLHLDSIPEDRFQMLVLDEAHKLRNLYGVETPPQVAKKFRKALEERRFRFVLMLTATPIHNRLWDLYSLVDLLTVARGHQNPFGSEGAFARKFIADGREQARQLKPEARDEFRSIVYGYMSRVRRGDAKLYFPEREVQLHKVDPTSAELDLIKTIAKPIQALNRLAQISILQALASSPDALMAQLTNMARNGTVPAQLAATVRNIVVSMPLSAKLLGLQVLISELKKKDPAKWRLVVFTTRLETQTTIQTFLESNGLKVGIINGNSGSRNQETIVRFRKDPPDCHVIVSTEAGSEGVNLQVANVLVNYDLPWNPMIVEQRIGRVQRLASKHAKVGIFNIILRGTFEEYIVGRLMEKLQMASHAIGDIDALLEASGVNDDDDGGATSFDEKIRQLVVASLSGKNVELETRQAVESIDRAKADLEREQSTINVLLGDSTGEGYVGPRAPKLPTVTRSMTPREFTLRAFPALGVRITESDSGFVAEENGGEEFIHFEGEPPSHPKSTLYAQGTPGFSRLVSQMVATGVHNVRDRDDDPTAKSRSLVTEWVSRFASSLTGMEIRDVRRRFAGTALVRVRATVAHDGYERLVEIPCSSDSSIGETNRSFISPLPSAIDDPRAIGVALKDLATSAQSDDAIGEFWRFYIERRELEKKAAGSDERKRQKLEDDFTPRLEMSLVGLDGELHRDVTVQARYKIDDFEYSSALTLKPYAREIVDQPELSCCGKTGRTVPLSCLKECQISGTRVLQHLLERSEKSQRSALPEFVVTCGLTGKRLLRDEAEPSGVTGKLIDKSLLKTSVLAGTKAEPEYFGKCDFSKDDLLKTELAVSEISGKTYRQDQRGRSVVSGKAGHKDEFIACSQTGHSLTLAEAERCGATGSYVQPGILEECAVSGKRVLPSELERCGVTGKRAMRSLFVTSSVSGMRMLEDSAIRSATGQFCASPEVGQCAWSSRQCHPADLRVCRLTGLPILYQFAGSAKDGHALQPLLELLEGVKRNGDKKELWSTIAGDASGIIGKGRCQVEAAVLSPTGNHLAASVEVRTMLGFRTHQAGVVYALSDTSVVGRVALGQRKANTWAQT